MPWTTEYGSTRVPLHTQLTNMNSINFDALAWHMRNPSSTPPTSQHIEIEISGIPPHLCSDATIHRLLDGIYDIQRITFLHSNITYWVLAHTSDILAIPSIAHLGVERATQNGDSLNIWPLWYNTRPADLVNFIYPRDIQKHRPNVEVTALRATRPLCNTGNHNF